MFFVIIFYRGCSEIEVVPLFAANFLLGHRGGNVNAVKETKGPRTLNGWQWRIVSLIFATISSLFILSIFIFFTVHFSIFFLWYANILTVYYLCSRIFTLSTVVYDSDRSVDSVWDVTVSMCVCERMPSRPVNHVTIQIYFECHSSGVAGFEGLKKRKGTCFILDVTHPMSVMRYNPVRWWKLSS